MSEPAGQRLDKWLWYARLAKTRTLATQLVTTGKVRVNREKISKPSRLVRASDVITAVIHGRVRILKVLAPGARRGPAAEARTLYDDMSPPPPERPVRGAAPAPAALREKGAGRPTKRDRRLIDAWTGERRRNGE
jgi:ribosome-associated heat shock protein Hsp15